MARALTRALGEPKIQMLIERGLDARLADAPERQGGETVTLPQRPSGSPEIRDELRHTLAARQELGPALDDELIDSFARRIQGVIAEEVARQVGGRSQASQQLLDWKKEMYAITLGCGIPIVAIAAWVGSLTGVVVVCVILAVISIAVTWRSG